MADLDAKSEMLLVVCGTELHAKELMGRLRAVEFSMKRSECLLLMPASREGEAAESLPLKLKGVAGYQVNAVMLDDVTSGLSKALEATQRSLGGHSMSGSGPNSLNLALKPEFKGPFQIPTGTWESIAEEMRSLRIETPDYIVGKARMHPTPGLRPQEVDVLGNVWDTSIPLAHGSPRIPYKSPSSPQDPLTPPTPEELLTRALSQVTQDQLYGVLRSFIRSDTTLPRHTYVDMLENLIEGVVEDIHNT